MAFIAFAGSVITIRYARQLGVEPASRRWLSVPRLVIAAVVYVLFLGGLLRALWGAGPASVREGFVIGLGLGLVGAVAGGLWAIRAADRARPERADTDS